MGLKKICGLPLREIRLLLTLIPSLFGDVDFERIGELAVGLASELVEADRHSYHCRTTSARESGEFCDYSIIQAKTGMRRSTGRAEERTEVRAAMNPLNPTASSLTGAGHGAASQAAKPYILRTTLPGEGVTHVWIECLRAGQPFSEHERHLLGDLRRCLAVALQCASSSRLQAKETEMLSEVLGHNQQGAACLNEQGGILWVTPHARQWLREFRPSESVETQLAKLRRLGGVW